MQMDKKENNSELSHNIKELNDFEIWKIRDETTSYIFQNLNDEKSLKEFTDKFDDIFYLSLHPSNIEEYKSNPAIYEILKRYKHTAERHKLEIMIFKMKEISEKQKQETLNRFKKMYPELDIKLDETKYQYIVGYFGWTAWRTNSSYMEKIKKIYPVKILH